MPIFQSHSPFPRYIQLNIKIFVLIFNCVGQRDTLALDEEQAPCQSDSTDFPSRSTFMVKSDIQIPATLDYMNVWGDSINGDSAFSQYVQSSKSGKYQFSDLHTQWTKENCDSTGCACRPKD